MWRSWFDAIQSNSKSSAKVRIFSRFLKRLLCSFTRVSMVLSGFVTFAILGWEVFASLLLWFEAGFAYMMNDNATACLMWQAMVKGCFVVWKAVGNHTHNFELGWSGPLGKPVAMCCFSSYWNTLKYHGTWPKPQYIDFLPCSAQQCSHGCWCFHRLVRAIRRGNHGFAVALSECRMFPPRQASLVPDCQASLPVNARWIRMVWSDFLADLSRIVKQYWSVLLSLTLAIIGFVTVVLSIGSTSLLFFPLWVIPVGVVVASILVCSGRYFVVSRNAALDAQIHRLCDQLTSATAGAVQVQYRTEWTGFAKPPHLGIARVIAFAPRAAWNNP